MKRGSPIAVVMPAVAMVVMPMPRPIAADLARSVIGPDHPAVAVRIGVIARIIVVGRCVEAPMEMMVPVMRRHAIAAVTDAAEAMTAAMEDRCGAKTAAMDRNAAGPESSAMKRGAAAMKTAAATEATTTVEAAAMAATTMTAAASANLNRQPVSDRFR